MKVYGKYGEAVIYNDVVDSNVVDQVATLMNHPMAQDAHVRIMPDCHAGKGCVIGYTAKMHDYIVPNLVGVDIGCSVSAMSINHLDIPAFNERFKKLVPVGRNIHETPVYEISDLAVRNMENFEKVCDVIGMDKDYMKRSLGTLGGGNHYGEIDVDSNGDWWFTLHTGSRNFGLKVVTYFQKKAMDCDFSKEIEDIKKNYSGKDIETNIKQLDKKRKPKGLEWLEDADKENYLNFMDVAQEYAKANHDIIQKRLFSEDERRFITISYCMKVVKLYYISHNYIDMWDYIVRKGAVSAKKEEEILIPLNMKDGILLCKGKGNPDWNFSAPHGAGRLMSRTKAKEEFTLEEFEKSMEGIYSTCVSENTLDESPMAYKDAEDIKRYITPTADILDHWKPIWNYKG
jgi:tRNA-splicing ligase RtcB (3'-phosphate/5'-hydroxy nucleic acid ligase)